MAKKISDELQKTIQKGKEIVNISGAQLLSFESELKKMEKREEEIWKKLSLLL